MFIGTCGNGRDFNGLCRLLSIDISRHFWKHPASCQETSNKPHNVGPAPSRSFRPAPPEREVPPNLIAFTWPTIGKTKKSKTKNQKLNFFSFLFFPSFGNVVFPSFQSFWRLCRAFSSRAMGGWRACPVKITLKKTIKTKQTFRVTGFSAKLRWRNFVGHVVDPRRPLLVTLSRGALWCHTAFPFFQSFFWGVKGWRRARARRVQRRGGWVCVPVWGTTGRGCARGLGEKGSRERGFGEECRGWKGMGGEKGRRSWGVG